MRHLFVYISHWSCWHPHTAHNDCVQALTKKKCTLLKVQTLQQNFSFVPHSFPDTLTKPYLRETAKKKQWLCDLESENRTAPIGASLVTEKSFNKTERCILDVKGLNQSVAFLSKKAVEFSAVLLFFCLPLPKRLNCWLIFVSRLDSLPLALHLLPLILTRLLTPKSEDPSSLASGNELVRWAVRFIAHEAGVSLCECVSVYGECLSACVSVCVCVGRRAMLLSQDFKFIACLHGRRMCTSMWGREPSVGFIPACVRVFAHVCTKLFTSDSVINYAT